MKRILSLVALCLLAPAVFAAPNFFTPSTNDQSMYYLAALFGEVGNVLTQWTGQGNESTLLKYAFLYFNNAVIVLGCIIILYTLIVSTINTSHEGETMGKKWNSVWIPLRSAMGFALLLPVTTSTLGMKDIATQGYAVIQVFVMWVIVQGVGAADYIWNNMVDQIGSGNATVTISSSTDTDMATATSAFQYLICNISYMQSQKLKNYFTQDYNNRNGQPGAAWSSPFGKNGNGISNKNDNNKENGKKYQHNYGQSTPYIQFQKGGANAQLPYNNVWSFGNSLDPSDWLHRSICGSISLPTGEEVPVGNATRDPLIAYYTRQQALINKLLGFDPAISPLYARGIYGGNWFGMYPTDGKNPGDPTSAAATSTEGGGPDGAYAFAKAGVPIVTGLNYKTTENLPNVAYLADTYMVYLDTGSLPTSPADPVGTNSQSNTSGATSTDGQPCFDDQGNPILVDGKDEDGNSAQVPQDGCPAVSDAGSTGTQNYIEEELGKVAVAYQAATLANYQQYQDDLAGQGSLTNKQRKDNLIAVAKYNGWASAGAFFLDMTKVLNTWSDSFSATTNDYSYPTLACVPGVGINDAGANRSCQDARAATDLVGNFRVNDKNKQGYTHAYGLGNNTLNKTLTAADSIAMTVLGSAVGNEDDGSGCTDKNGDPVDPVVDVNGDPVLDANGNPVCPVEDTGCTPLTDDQGNILLNKDGKPLQSCGIYNSAANANFAFNPDNFTKPHFPYALINPLGWYHYVNGMIMYNFAQTLKPIMNMSSSAGVLQSPLFVLRQAGLRLLNTSSKLYWIGFRYMWISGLVTYPFSGFTGILGAMQTALTWGSAMYTAMIGMMMTMGAIMAYYFPMIPYLVFTFAFIQWLILVIEAMTAAPMLSLGILNPEGPHEAFGQSSMGVALLASVFLRPSLMIIGYFAATVMSYITVLIVNGGFFFSANSLLGGMDASGGTASMFGTLIIWGMYINTLMVVLNKSFSLIYHIPDHIMRWIGINEERTDVESMMGEIKGGVKEGAQTGKSMADAEMSARRSSMKDYKAGADELKSKIKGK